MSHESKVGAANLKERCLNNEFGIKGIGLNINRYKRVTILPDITRFAKGGSNVV